MRFFTYLSELALLSTLSQAVVLPQHHGEESLLQNLDTEVKVVLSSRTNLADLAKELRIDAQCLKAANPLLWSLERDESCIVPQACCGTSCKGKFCSQRPQCYGQTSSTTPIQTGSSTTCYSTLTTSVESTSISSSSSTLQDHGSSGFLNATSTVPSAGTSPSPSLSSSTSSDEVVSGSNSATSSVISTGSSGSIPFTTSSELISITSAGETISPGSPSSSTSSSSLGGSSNSNTAETTNTTGDNQPVPPSTTAGTGTLQTTSSTGPAESVSIVSTNSSASPSSILSGGILTTTTNSDGSVVTSTVQSVSSAVVTSATSANATVTLSPPNPSPSSNAITLTDANGSGTTTIQGSSSSFSATTTGEQITQTTNSDEVGTTFSPGLPSSSSSSILGGGVVTTTNPDGSVITTTLESSVVTTTNSDGSVISITLSSDITTTTNSDGSEVTTTPESGVVTTTNSDGSQIVTTFESGVITTTNPDGSVVTSLLESGVVTTTDSAGSLITTTTLGSSGSSISSVDSVSPSDSISSITNSSSTTIAPGASSVGPSSSDPSLSTTSSTIISSDSVSSTVSQDVSSSATTTFDGSSSSIASSDSEPSSSSLTTSTNSDGSVVPSSTDASPSTADTPITTDNPDSSATNVTSDPGTLTSPTITSPLSSSATSTDVAGGIIPITTPVPEPTGTDEGSIIPCHTWFFNICINWLDLDVTGWLFTLPVGVRPPGPPPPITFPPSLSIEINTIGPLPNWPTITVGPDNVPTPEAEPENCETESAELCMTRTSFAVSSTVTTDTQVLSTCATVYGCKVSDSASETSTTSTCSTCSTCYSWPYDEGFDYGDEDADASDGPVFARRMMPREVPAATTSPAPTHPPVNPLARRTQTENRVSTAFGTCTLVATMTMENYPGVEDLPNFPAASSYFVVSRGGKDAAGTCYAGRIYSTSDIAGVSAVAGGLPYATGSPYPKGAPVVNMDHVYENSLLGTFFEYALGLPDAPSCDQFKSYFVETGRLQSLFKQLANVNNPDFAAMDKFINQMKASFFTSTDGLPKIPAGKYADALRHLQGYAMVADFLNMPEIVSLFRSTHERIYQAFGEWDQDFGLCNQDGLSDTWAATYSGWMTGFLSSRADFVTASASAWYQTLVDGGAAAPVYTQLQNSYPVALFVVSVDALAAGLIPAATQGIVPRQAACTLSAPQTSQGSSASSVAPPTDLPTLTPTVSVSSSSVLSCESVTTFEQCNGSGNQAACITTSSCVSLEPTEAPSTIDTSVPTDAPISTEAPSPTSTTPTSTTFEAPLFTSPVVCNDEADFPGHADISANAQLDLAIEFCDNHNTDMYPSDPGPPLSENLQDGDDINYLYSISWNDQDCRPEGADRQNTFYPQGSAGITCPLLMVLAYQQCDNGGVGGYIDVGCLRYRFNGGD